MTKSELEARLSELESIMVDNPTLENITRYNEALSHWHKYEQKEGSYSESAEKYKREVARLKKEPIIVNKERKSGATGRPVKPIFINGVECSLTKEQIANKYNIEASRVRYLIKRYGRNLNDRLLFGENNGTLMYLNGVKTCASLAWARKKGIVNYKKFLSFLRENDNKLSSRGLRIYLKTKNKEN